MNIFKQPRVNLDLPVHAIEVVEPDPENCPAISHPPEGNVKLRNYRMLNENICTYSPTGDINTSPSKGKLVPKYEVCSTVSPPRQKILDLLRPEDPGRDTLEAIVRPAPRRGLARPFDEDTRRFLQRALLTPSPQISTTATPEHRPVQESKESSIKSSNGTPSSKSERSLADELKEAEEEEKSGGIRQELLREFRKRGGGMKEAMERERMGKLALSVEEDEDEDSGLSVAARRLDALLAESRNLHEELAGIHEDMQAEVKLNGIGKWKGKHITSTVRLVAGPYDPLLEWPCDLSINIVLKDQPAKRSQAMDIVKTLQLKRKSSSRQHDYEEDNEEKTKSTENLDMNVVQMKRQYIFIPHTSLDKFEYIKNDVMFLEFIAN